MSSLKKSKSMSNNTTNQLSKKTPKNDTTRANNIIDKLILEFDNLPNTQKILIYTILSGLFANVINDFVNLGDVWYAKYFVSLLTIVNNIIAYKLISIRADKLSQ